MASVAKAPRMYLASRFDQAAAARETLVRDAVTLLGAPTARQLLRGEPVEVEIEPEREQGARALLRDIARYLRMYGPIQLNEREEVVSS